MAQVAEAFRYDDANGVAGASRTAAASISIFADRDPVRSRLADQALETGLILRQSEPLSRLLGEDAVVLGDVIIVDAPIVGAQLLAALARLDMRSARNGSQLIVSTGVDAIDAVFGCVDQSCAQILIAPNDCERALALGTALSRVPVGAVHELSGEDRLALVRLTEQVQMLARKMDGFSGQDDLLPGEREGDSRAVRSPNFDYMAAGVSVMRQESQDSPSLPRPALVREIIRQRQLRSRFFDEGLFADPAWDILLDLTAAIAESKQVSVSSLCIAACVPPTTALRWISQMTEAGLLDRVQDPEDRRRAFIELSEKSATAMAQYFERLDNGAAVV
ncbi:MarR family transcriptional regulator [Croceicoccus ponticola]|uniref:MarR family transcriptional regulator n=1 Tax=Croceicoccus ponticola TaxID=2217664 RepID=A0A437GWY7_9SPHN|nr:MarR family transcriptional regulator [Croceicoccus ponticola]RVQ65534.1 MarR family transcriptional regulator [Croceicoccus ponticola]